MVSFVPALAIYRRSPDIKTDISIEIPFVNGGIKLKYSVFVVPFLRIIVSVFSMIKV
jgi:hypothetical protein